MTFERLVQDQRFVSELLTTAVGQLGLERPATVHRADAHVSVDRTRRALVAAHDRAVARGDATIINALALPFVGMEADDTATPVKPDFAIVAARTVPADPDESVGSWLIMGDAKDYERVRSRIDDHRMLKGFLQVALGAESAAAWSALPDGMDVHAWGALAVPRNAFLQPEAVVERLDDHRREVRFRADERRALLAEHNGHPLDEAELAEFVEHLEATFDPRSCVSCSLFSHCRAEVRAANTPDALLVEIGVRPEERAGLVAVAAGGEPSSGASASAVAGVRATVRGLPEWTGQLRVDPLGEPGTIEVVLAKADAAALGIHGLAVRRVRSDRTRTDWTFAVFRDPQSPATRLAVLRAVGRAVEKAMADRAAANPSEPGPFHLITPDSASGDVLVSIADSHAGVEISRLRWARDLEVGRPALTFNGEPAKVPKALSDRERLAVSFLLEADRARAMTVRNPLVDLRAVLARHVVPGGPAVDAGRLDYLVVWAEAASALDHRAVSDQIAASPHTPGARLANSRSDAVHGASRGRSTRGGRSKPDLAEYESLVRAELEYKADVMDRARVVLESIGSSKLRPVYEALECDAQVVWRRRLHLRASDLVRFGLTSDYWRNEHVEMLDADETCAMKLSALGNPQAALDLARKAGTKEMAVATVTSAAPIRLDVASRHLGDGSKAVAVLVGEDACAEAPTTRLDVQRGSFKFSGLAIGPLAADAQTDEDGTLAWVPSADLSLQEGDEVVLADAGWFKTFVNPGQLAVARPAIDVTSAPTTSCYPDSYENDPDEHRYCCRPHEVAEAQTADWLADRRACGELNPQTWPPVVDEDQFDVRARGSRTAADEAADVADTPDPDLTIDDLD